jgi:hypothetical protein
MKVYIYPPGKRDDGVSFNSVPVNPKLQVDLGKLPNLAGCSVLIVAASAGLGHKRPARALDEAVKGNLPRMYIQSISGAVHSAGSSGWMQDFVELSQANKELEFRWEKVHLAMLLSEKDDFLIHFKHYIRTLSQDTVVCIFTHHDAAILCGFYRAEIEKDTGKKLVLVMVVTDHFPTHSQYVWERLEADVIIAPDRLTQASIMEGLRLRLNRFTGDANGTKRYRVPIVLNAGGYPLQLPFSGKRTEKNQKQPFRILFPLGGAAPGKAYIAQCIARLHIMLSQLVPYVVIRKPAIPDRTYTDFMATITTWGVSLYELGSDDESIDCVTRVITSAKTSPDCIVTKPSEWVNLVQYAGDEWAGAPIALLSPVGYQEVENVAWLRSESGGHSLLSATDNARLISFLQTLDTDEKEQSNRQKKELEKWKDTMKGYRAITLPDDAIEAAYVLDSCVRYGIFAAMRRFRRPRVESLDFNPCMPVHFWKLVDGTLPNVRVQKLPYYIPPIPTSYDTDTPIADLWKYARNILHVKTLPADLQVFAKYLVKAMLDEAKEKVTSATAVYYGEGRV